MSVPFVIAVTFFFNDTATTEIYTLSLHDALPIFAAALLPAIVSAQAYPSKPVKIIVPAQPGGGLDRKSTPLNSSHTVTSYHAFCLENIGGAGATLDALIAFLSPSAQ